MVGIALDLMVWTFRELKGAILFDMKWFLHYFQPGEPHSFWIFLCAGGFLGKLAIQIFLDGLIIFIPHSFFILHFKCAFHSSNTFQPIFAQIFSSRSWVFYQNHTQKYSLKSKIRFLAPMFVFYQGNGIKDGQHLIYCGTLFLTHKIWYVYNFRT